MIFDVEEGFLYDNRDNALAVNNKHNYCDGLLAIIDFLFFK